MRVTIAYRPRRITSRSIGLPTTIVRYKITVRHHSAAGSLSPPSRHSPCNTPLRNKILSLIQFRFHLVLLIRFDCGIIERNAAHGPPRNHPPVHLLHLGSATLFTDPTVFINIYVNWIHRPVSFNSHRLSSLINYN